MTIESELKKICTMARPLIEQALDIAEELAAMRDAATDKGLDWSQIKALLKAQIQDERDGEPGKRVGRIVERADFASEYASLLGLTKVNENNNSAPAVAPVAPILPTTAMVIPRKPTVTPDDLDFPASLDRRVRA